MSKDKTELDQIWAEEPGSFLRVTRDDETGAVTLEWRTGPQGSLAVSTCRASLELTNYRAKRLAAVLRRPDRPGEEGRETE